MNLRRVFLFTKYPKICQPFSKFDTHNQPLLFLNLQPCFFSFSLFLTQNIVTSAKTTNDTSSSSSSSNVHPRRRRRSVTNYPKKTLELMIVAGKNILAWYTKEVLPQFMLNQGNVVSIRGGVVICSMVLYLPHPQATWGSDTICYVPSHFISLQSRK